VLPAVEATSSVVEERFAKLVQLQAESA